MSVSVTLSGVMSVFCGLLWYERIKIVYLHSTLGGKRPKKGDAGVQLVLIWLCHSKMKCVLFQNTVGVFRRSIPY